MAYHQGHVLPGHYETHCTQGQQLHLQARPASIKFPNGCTPLDQDSTLRAIETLKADPASLPVLKYIIHLPSACIEAFATLLDQVQKNASVDWLTDVIISEDPGQYHISIPETGIDHAQRDDTSYWTTSSATTCHGPAVDICKTPAYHHDGIGLQSPFVPQVSFCAAAAATVTDTHQDPDVYNFESNNYNFPTGVDVFSQLASIRNEPSDAVVPLNTLANENHSYENHFGKYSVSGNHLPNDYDMDMTQSCSAVPVYNQDYIPGLTSNTKFEDPNIEPAFWISESIPPSQKSAETINIHMYNPGLQARDETSRSPCPLCKSGFVSRTELAAHMQAEHDQSIRYQCLHENCMFTTWRSAHITRHHTKHHEPCVVAQHRTAGLATHCYIRQPKPRQKKVWGCWLCAWETSTGAELWARHQLEQHKGCKRAEMSHTWLIKSLLSQPRIRLFWQTEIRPLERSGQPCMVKWSGALRDTARDKVIEALETGFWKGRAFATDDAACRGVVMAAMEAMTNSKKVMALAMKHGKSCIKRPVSPAPISGFRRIRSVQQHLFSAFTHGTPPGPDTSGTIASSSERDPKRQSSLVLLGIRNHPGTSLNN